jgi:hypothetical protein
MGARRVVAGLLAAVISASVVVACEPPAPTPRVPGRGTYLGRPDPAAVEEFSEWAGPPPTTHISSFVPPGRDGTRGFRQIDGWIEDVLPLVEGSTRRLVVSLPLVPAGSTLASVKEGDGHRRLTKLASALRASGHGRAVIRLGWESNGSWFPRWYAGEGGDPVGYRRAFRAVVRTLRAAAPGLRFEWNVVCHSLPEVVPWYPGDGYVDLVGMDCYARSATEKNRWPAALEWAAAFAERHGKRVAISEWGTSLDDAGLVRTFLRWAQAHSVAYHIYWNAPPAPGEEDTRLSGQPRAAEAYRQNGA